MISGISGGYYANYYTQMHVMRSQAENIFEKFDSNGDGSLDETEISAFAEKISEISGQAVDVEGLVSNLDSDEDGLVSEEEFEAGRSQGPKGPPPPMTEMTGASQDGGIQSLLDILNSSEDEDVSGFKDSLDTNGDGTVDAEEAKAGINYLIQNYQNQLAGILNQGTENGSQINLLG